jgi:two-component system, cell cycle sensor histidine kinase and response regulator CckA
LEERAFQSQKMEIVGTLAGGIAHEFNNLLMGIQGNASLMLLDMETSHPHYRKLHNIERHVARGGELTQQLLGFAGEGKYEITRTDLNDVVSKTSDIFGRARKGIRIQRQVEKELWPLEADQRQMEQMLLNLFINAWEAMRGGGDLSIETRNVMVGEEQAMTHGVSAGKYVLLTVSDSGPGIDEKIKGKIFEPFFTTKEIGKGVGLGLAAVYGIVKNHGGFINVISGNGHGATFQIYLPSLEAAQVESPVQKGKGTVLLVDDEEMIIDLGKAMLEAMGYTVLWAMNSKDALETYRRSTAEIDMVILDAGMGDRDSGQTYDELKKLNPQVKVLLSSGYEIDGRATQILTKGCKGFIQKPFQMKELSRKIRFVLGG